MFLNLVLQCQAKGAVSILWKYSCTTEVNGSFYFDLHAGRIRVFV